VILAFDVNETLLDLAALDAEFERRFGDATMRQQWFSQMLQLAFTGGLTGRYADFPSAQRAALSMLAAVEAVELRREDFERLSRAMRTLPPHPEVDGALRSLHDAGFTLVALTNSPLDTARAQVAGAGLEEHFDAVMSADEVQALKPRREAYALVGDRCGVPLEQVRLVAAHAWDVSGALAAGCAAAFVARPGKVPSPLGPQPDIVGADLSEVAAAIVAADSP
jgi:2-haloacid dehalogenase